MIIAKYKDESYKIVQGRSMSGKINFINRVVYFIIFAWSAVLFGIMLLFVYENYSYADALAKHEAIVSVKKDLAYRTWVASHGGVYVPITQRTPPNPYLSHIKDRDITTSSNQNLTLMNPAYTLSQMMKDYGELYGIQGHITSIVLTNPKNKPDSWESEVLQRANKSATAEFKKTYIEEKEYLRYLKPLIIKKSCLKCHSEQGYKLGDVRGGVSVSIPMKKYNDRALKYSIINVVVIFIIYLIGLSVIFYGRKKAKEILENKIKNYEQHIFSLVNIIEKRDSYTAGHTQRVAKYSKLIAQEMGYTKEKVDTLYRACMLHDIGKISTPDSILLKPGKLTSLEYDIIKDHVVVSYELLSEVDIYKDIAEIIRHHHEHYDGSGYPQGLKGDAIPIMSQIMTIADSFDAMTTNRIYKARKSVTTAIEELKALAAKQFHPDIVESASKALHEIVVENQITQRPSTKTEEERFSYFYKDKKTSLYNKDYLEFILAYNSVDEYNLKYAYVICLHNFNQYNKQYSWRVGDELLKKFAKGLDSLNVGDFVFRVQGDDFIMLRKDDYDISVDIPKLEEILKGTGVTLSFRCLNLDETTDISVFEKMT